MPKILRTRQSRDDYISIHEFIAKDSPLNAAMVLQLFDEKLRLLSNNPMLGLHRTELAPDVRSWVVHHFVLFYRPLDDGIILLRVLHASMDITPRYFVGT